MPDDAVAEPPTDFGRLGRDLVRGWRVFSGAMKAHGPDARFEDLDLEEDPAHELAGDILRHGGGDELADPQILDALLAALDEAVNDDEVWFLGDGFVPETVFTRPKLMEQVRALRSTDQRIAGLFRVMKENGWEDDRASWAELDAE